MLSFVVIAYNVERTIERCLASIQCQTLGPFEAIVVDDGSHDVTRAIVERFVKTDNRFKLVAKDSNEGAHLARKSGVEASSGDYVIFVDGDDEIDSSALEALLALALDKKFDMLRFGRTVVVSGTEGASNAKADEAMFNCSPIKLEGEGILSSAFSEWGSEHSTWSIIDVLFDGNFVRDAFVAMTSERLGRTQDAYEMFVIMSRAQQYLAVQDYHVLRYHLGDGVSGHSYQSVDKFRSGQEGMHASLAALQDYAQSTGKERLKSCADWYAKRMYDTISAEWTSRITVEDEAKAFEVIRTVWGDGIAALVVLAPLNGRMEWLLSEDDEPSFHLDIYLSRWRTLLRSLSLPSAKTGLLKERFAKYQQLEAEIAHRIKELDCEKGAPWEQRFKTAQENQMRSVQESVDANGSLFGKLVRKIRRRFGN